MARILCCLCGLEIEANDANMCSKCLSTQVDITQDVSREGVLLQCNGCLRFQRSKSSWCDSGLESQELMAICLKNIQGLGKVRLLDANFIWTEPHSKRIKVKVTVQKEVLARAKVSQHCVVTFVVNNLKCPDCNKGFTNATWKSQVQVRQKVDHKRTFYYLEQLILKFNAHEHASSIESDKDGINVFFQEKKYAEKFVNFVSSHFPVKSKSSSKLVSSDNHNNTANLKLTTVVEICWPCKFDLVILPSKVAASCSQISRVVIVYKIASQIHIVDPMSGQVSRITGEKFWRNPFESLQSSPMMIEFVVLDIEPLECIMTGEDSHFRMADVEVARASDFGVNDTRFVVKTHLGSILQVGDSVKGYDLSTCNFSTNVGTKRDDALPDIVLVQKVYVRSNNKKKLKSLKTTSGSKTTRATEEQEARDYDQFVSDFDAECVV